MSAQSLEIVNMVASGRLQATFSDLPSLSARLSEVLPRESVEHSTRRGNRLNIRSDRFEPLLVLAPSGTYVVTGATSRDQIETTQSVLFGALSQLELIPSDKPTEETNEVFLDMRNIVATGTLGSRQDLDEIALRLGLEVVEYEPETFPGLVYRPPKIEGVSLVFASGSLVLTGVSQPAELDPLYEDILDHLGDPVSEP